MVWILKRLNVEKAKTICQAPTVHRYQTLQFFSWQKHSEKVTVQLAKHCGANFRITLKGFRMKTQAILLTM